MKKLYIILLIMFSLQISLFCAETPKQTPWNVLNIKGYSIDEKTGKIDDTEGFGAFDSIMQLFKPVCSSNFDNGGGSFDDASKYIKEKYNIDNIVYDPYMRSQEHNDKVLALTKNKKFDCCTSISVLNVIDTKEAREKHIKMCHCVLKENGNAFYKIWPGNDSGIEIKEKGRYQSNKNAQFYLDEIKNVFGADNVELIDSHTIKAVKKTNSRLINSYEYLKYTNPKVIQKLYQLMKDMHDIFTHHKINYWVDGGTLLGAVRHKGLILWDDDLDVSIEKKHERKLISLIPVVNSLGYSFKKTSFGYKVFPKDGNGIIGSSWKYPFFDIFIIYRKGDKLYYQTWHDDEPKREGEINFVRVNEIYPLKEYEFGPLKVMGPNNPFPYLQTWYGNDWNTIAYKSYDHSKEQKIEKKFVNLNDELRKPALPPENLKQRFNVKI